MLLLLLIAVALGGSPDVCHPPCVQECETLTEVARCGTVCEPPACTVLGCSENVPARCYFPSCRVSCPPDQCQNQCPACETLCEPLPSICTEGGCAILCQETECSWRCRKPERPPTPVCQWACEEPACAAPSEAGRLLSMAIATMVLVLFVA